MFKVHLLYRNCIKLTVLFKLENTLGSCVGKNTNVQQNYLKNSQPLLPFGEVCLGVGKLDIVDMKNLQIRLYLLQKKTVIEM